MTVHWIIFDPVDTLMFGTGRPFHQDDEGRAVASSIFPPTPTTIAGAVRVAVARALGWIAGDWSDPRSAQFASDDAAPVALRCQAVTELLGNRDDPGSLKIWGPFTGTFDRESFLPFYAAPHFLRLAADGKLISLGPSQPLGSDLQGTPCFIASGPPGAQDVAGRPISGDTIRWALSGRDGHWQQGDGDMPSTDRLWRREVRVGLQRDVATRRAIDGRLYVSTRVRLQSTAFGPIVVAALVEGIDESIARRLPREVPIGGESRAAAIHCVAAADGSTIEPELDGLDRFVAVLLTPALLSVQPQVGARISGLGDARLVTMAAGRCVAVAGFDSTTGRLGSAGQRVMVPAGAAFFMRGIPPLGRTLGESVGAGYGRVAIGRWPRQSEEAQRP